MRRHSGSDLSCHGRLNPQASTFQRPGGLRLLRRRHRCDPRRADLAQGGKRRGDRPCAARRNEMRKAACLNCGSMVSMNSHLRLKPGAPAEVSLAAHGARWRGCRCSWRLHGKRVAGSGRHAGCGLEGGAVARPRARMSMSMPANRRRSCLQSSTRRGAAARLTLHRREWRDADLASERPSRWVLSRTMRRPRALPASARAAGASGQCDRQAEDLRLQLRRHRQPLAAGDRHLDRRRGADLCPGDPRQA